MKISTRFPVAIHILAALEYPPNNEYNTSETLAHSVNTNPVVIRRILGQLKKAGLVKTRPGVAGTALARELGEITLLDIYNAVNGAEESLFAIHQNPNLRCIVGANIQDVLGGILSDAQSAMEHELEKVSMTDIVALIDAHRVQ